MMFNPCHLLLLVFLISLNTTSHAVNTTNEEDCGNADRSIITLPANSTTTTHRATIISLHKLGYTHIELYTHLNLLSACPPSNITNSLFRHSTHDISDDASISISSAASWALDRLDQESLPLDNRAYAPDNCTRHHGSAVRAYVIDTGCEVGHEVFHERRIETRSLRRKFGDGRDDNGHGTRVASLLNGRQTGVAKGMQVVCIKALGKSGTGLYSDIIQAINHAVAQHIEQKFSTPTPTPSPTTTTTTTTTNSTARGTFIILSIAGHASRKTSLDTAVERAESAGVVVFGAAGNDNQDACSYTPGRAGIGVGSISRGDRLSGFSNWGSCVKAVAPGSRVLTARMGSGVRSASGTSYSAPLLAGVVGLMWNGGGAKEVREVLERGVRIGDYRMATLGNGCAGGGVDKSDRETVWWVAVGVVVGVVMVVGVGVGVWKGRRWGGRGKGKGKEREMEREMGDEEGEREEEEDEEEGEDAGE